MYGKSFRPYQPAGLWEALAFPDSSTARYVRDVGPDIYRRSLYMFWKRTSPPPMMLNFDAPMRESCVVRRSRTNTPLQALVTMNEPMFVESMRKMAERLLRGGKEDQARLNTAYLLCYSRTPSAKELQLLEDSLAKYRSRYASDPGGATELLSVGDSPTPPDLDRKELAAWSLVCGTLMNTDEFLTQH
jgi:hypothetical protein